jgi:repressor LexA
MTQYPLTKRRREIYDYLAAYLHEKGYAPSLGEIGARFGFSAPSTTHAHLQKLVDKGYIRRHWNKSRGIELIARGDACPTCGQPRPGAPLEPVGGTTP